VETAINKQCLSSSSSSVSIFSQPLAGDVTVLLWQTSSLALKVLYVATDRNNMSRPICVK